MASKWGLAKQTLEKDEAVRPGCCPCINFNERSAKRPVFSKEIRQGNQDNIGCASRIVRRVHIL